MGLFRSRKTRHLSSAPLPDWDDTRWRSHLRANALGTDHHCGIYLDMVNTDRKEAARLFRNEDDMGARKYAESSLRNKRIVAALAALSPICNALFQRSEPLAGYTSLVQIPEPARAGIVTIIFAAGRLQFTFLTETVGFLREQFGPVHIDAVQAGDGELASLVHVTVREALSPVAPEKSEVDSELASAVKEYFGIFVSPSNTGALPPEKAEVPMNGNSGIEERGLGNSNGMVSQKMLDYQDMPGMMTTTATATTIVSGVRDGVTEVAETAADATRNAATSAAAAVSASAHRGLQPTTAALSTHSSDLGGPQSPQFSLSSTVAPSNTPSRRQPPPSSYMVPQTTATSTTPPVVMGGVSGSPPSTSVYPHERRMSTPSPPRPRLYPTAGSAAPTPPYADAELHPSSPSASSKRNRLMPNRRVDLNALHPVNAAAFAAGRGGLGSDHAASDAASDHDIAARPQSGTPTSFQRSLVRSASLSSRAPPLDDSDAMLVRRYHHLRAATAV